MNGVLNKTVKKRYLHLLFLKYIDIDQNTYKMHL